MIEPHRRALDAATRFRSASQILYAIANDPPSDATRWLAGYEAENLLWKVLGDAELLVSALNDESDADDAERAAKRLVEALRARRIARKLENVAGRTPEEAETFLERARILRASA